MRRFMTEAEFDEKFAALIQALEAHRQARSIAQNEEQQALPAWTDDEDDEEESQESDAEEIEDLVPADAALRVEVGHIELDEQALLVPGGAGGRTYPWFQVVNIQGERASEASTRFAALPATVLTSGGMALEWRLTSEGSMLYAYSGQQEVLRLVIDTQAGAAPAVQAALLAAIDHPVGQPLLKLELALVSQSGATQLETQLDIHILDAPAPNHSAAASSIQIMESAPFLHIPASDKTHWLAQQSGRWSHGRYATDNEGGLTLQLDSELLGPLPAGEKRSGKLASLQSSDGTCHELAIEIAGANDAALVLHGGSVRESAGWQHVALRVVDKDGPEQSMLQPDQWGEWSGGRYRTDAQGQLFVSVAVERLEPLPQGAQQLILLEGVRSQDGSLLNAVPITIHGENDRALIQDHITLQPFLGEQSVALAVLDRDGGIQQRLKPNQAGNWTHGKYWTDAAGQLVVSLDETKHGPLATGQSRFHGRISALQSEDDTWQDVNMEWASPGNLVAMQLGMTVQENAGAQRTDLSDADFLPLAVAPPTWLPNQSGGWSHGAFHTDANGRLVVFVDMLQVGALAEGESLFGRLVLQDDGGGQHTVAMQVQGGNSDAQVVNPIEILEQDDWQAVALHVRDYDGVAQSRLAPNLSGSWRLGEYHTDADGALSVLLDRTLLGSLAAGERHIEEMPGLASVDGSQLEIWVAVRGQNDAAQIQSRVTVSEAAGPQWVALTVTDVDGPAQSGLRPNQSGLWSHGRYQTDAAGRLSLEIDRDQVGALALDESPRMGVIQDLKSQDGSCQDVVVEITGLNDAAQIQERITLGAETGWQAPLVTVFDPDGASQSGLRPQQQGFWEHGAYQTDAAGQLLVWFDHTAVNDSDHRGAIKGLLSLDGSRQDVMLEVSEPSGCALLDSYLQPDGLLYM